MLKENELWKAKLQGFLLIREIKFPKDKTRSLIEPDRTQKLKTSPWYSGIVLRWDRVGRQFSCQALYSFSVLLRFYVKGHIVEGRKKNNPERKNKNYGVGTTQYLPRHLGFWGRMCRALGKPALPPRRRIYFRPPSLTMSLSNSG